MLVSSLNLSQSFNYTRYLFYKKSQRLSILSVTSMLSQRRLTFLSNKIPVPRVNSVTSLTSAFIFETFKDKEYKNSSCERFRV